MAQSHSQGACNAKRCMFVYCAFALIYDQLRSRFCNAFVSQLSTRHGRTATKIILFLSIQDASAEESLHNLEVTDDLQNTNGISRRSLGKMVLLATGISVSSSSAGAIVIDETERYANTSPDSSYAKLGSKYDNLSQSLPKTKQSSIETSDEITLRFSRQDFESSAGGLGIELGEVSFRTNSRVFIKSIRPNSLAASFPDKIKTGFVLVTINGQSIERTNAKGAQLLFARALKDLQQDLISFVEVTLRDPAVFEDSLNALDTSNTVTTQVAPAGETTQRNADGSIKLFESQTFQEAQKISVTQLTPPTFGNGDGAQVGDLLEISYVGRVLETQTVFDGSTVAINSAGAGIPGRAGDVTLFFVLGKQPFGQFPPGWDVGLKGMKLGERRRLLIPPVLAYGSKGLPRRGIPPDATLQYDVSLISINGLAIPTR